VALTTGPRIRNDDGTAAPDPTGRRAGGKSAAKEQRDSDADALKAFQIALGRAQAPHDKRVTAFRKRHDAYNGILDTAQDAPIRPRGVVLPRYAFQAAEVLISNLVDDAPRGQVIATSAGHIESARALEPVLNYYRREDAQDAKMTKHIRQVVIMGMGPGKTYWKHHSTPTKKMVWRTDPITGGMVGGEETVNKVIDRPSFEPIPVYDFMYDPSASRTDEMAYCIFRFWTTVSSLKAEGRYRNLDKISDTRPDIAGEQKATGRDHAGRIEVFEYWTRTRLITVVNRTIVIGDEPNPFYHAELPCICANTTPDLYTCDGISVMDLLIPLQATAWDILNQLLRNVDIANLLMVKVNRTSRFDEKQLTNADVGAIFHVDNTNDVEFWNAGGNILEPGMDALQMIKTTMQETTGTGVYLAGGASETVDQKTATGINVLSSMAQKLVLAMRSFVWTEYRRKSLQEIQLIQQYTSKPMEYRISGSQEFSTLLPWEIAGNFDYDVGDVSESLNRQTARGEAQQLVGQFVQGAQAMQMAGIRPNWRKVYGGLLDAYDKLDADAYLENIPPPPPMAPPAPPGPGGPAAPPPVGAGAMG
jgi:hypothetical protein